MPVGVVCGAVALFWKEAGVESVVGSGLASRGVDHSGDEGAGDLDFKGRVDVDPSSGI